MATKSRKPNKGTLAAEMAARRKKADTGWDEKAAAEQDARGEVYHYGNQKVIRLPKMKEDDQSTSFKMIKQAAKATNTILQENQAMVARLTAIAEQQSITPDALTECVTNLLANIAVTVQEGKPIKLMHLNSVAAFMAGVEAMSEALSTTQDEAKKQKTLRVLAVAGLGEDGFVNMATLPIINIGAQKEALKSKYMTLIQEYMTSQQSGKPNGTALMAATRQLQFAVDRAMRSSTAPRSLAPTGASMSGTPNPHM